MAKPDCPMIMKCLPDLPTCPTCKGSGTVEVGADRHGIDANDEPCELCGGTGYWKSNTAEFEGLCPNGCCSECGKPINSEYHIGKSCFNGPWEDEEWR